jgi:hypothetical protein
VGALCRAPSTHARRYHLGRAHACRPTTGSYSLPLEFAEARTSSWRRTAARPQQASAQCQWRRPHRWKASAPVSVPRPRPALGAERCPPGWWPGGRAGVWLGRLLEQTRSGAGASRPAERVGERDRRARRARALMPVGGLGVLLRRHGGVVDGRRKRAGWQEGGYRGQSESQGGKAAAVRAWRAAVDSLWAATFCRSATRSARARAIFWWYRSAVTCAGTTRRSTSTPPPSTRGR